MEHIKHDPNDFGGLQSKQMSSEEIGQRLCCATGCASFGYRQIEILETEPTQYRIICQRHEVLVWLLISASLGDPNPSQEAERIAEAIGMPFHLIKTLEPSYTVSPERFICLQCGGRMIPETVGMFSGRRWVHTCGISVHGIESEQV